MNSAATQQASAYSFFQWMRLWYSDAERPSLRMVPHNSLGCPRSDIECFYTDNGQANLQLNFMGLIGSTSSLPESLLAGIHQDAEISQTWKGLLELFNHRIYQMYYDAWQQRIPMVMWETGHTQWAERLSRRWQKPSLAQLRQCFRQWLGYKQVEITPFFPKTVPNPAVAVLGHSSLSGAYFIGAKCQSVLCSVQVIVRNVPVEQIQSLKSGAGMNLRSLLCNRLDHLFNGLINVYLHLESSVPDNSHSATGSLGRGCWLGVRQRQRIFWEVVL